MGPSFCSPAAMAIARRACMSVAWLTPRPGGWPGVYFVQVKSICKRREAQLSASLDDKRTELRSSISDRVTGPAMRKFADEE